MTRHRSPGDAAEDWLIANDPDGPGVIPARGRCQWPVVGRWLHRWGQWEPMPISYQQRRCMDCGRHEMQHR